MAPRLGITALEDVAHSAGAPVKIVFQSWEILDILLTCENLQVGWFEVSTSNNEQISILQKKKKIYIYIINFPLIVMETNLLTLSRPGRFLAKYKSFFFLEISWLLEFLCWRDISGDLFLENGLNVFSHKPEKTEKSSQK